ncbi:MAG: hypothetical protein GDA55_08720 [Cellvibrionales bacterium]|nr:hypothetical protein [Cellvibrionales bacterium]
MAFPQYNPGTYKNIRIPTLTDTATIQALAQTYDQTRHLKVPQYRDGECEIRQIWDAAVCKALGWDEAWLSGIRNGLHQEPHIRGKGKNQYSD